MINFLNDFEQERPAWPALESCSDIMCFIRFNDFDSHCFSRKIYQQDKKQKTIEWHYPYIWIALPRTGNISWNQSLLLLRVLWLLQHSLPVLQHTDLPMPDSSLYQKRKDQNADILLHRHLLHDCRHIPVIVRTRTAMQMEQYLRCDPFLRLARSDSSGLHSICRPRRNRKKHQKRL